MEEYKQVIVTYKKLILPSGIKRIKENFGQKIEVKGNVVLLLPDDYIKEFNLPTPKTFVPMVIRYKPFSYRLNRIINVKSYTSIARFNRSTRNIIYIKKAYSFYPTQLIKGWSYAFRLPEFFTKTMCRAFGNLILSFSDKVNNEKYIIYHERLGILSRLNKKDALKEINNEKVNIVNNLGPEKNINYFKFGSPLFIKINNDMRPKF